MIAPRLASMSMNIFSILNTVLKNEMNIPKTESKKNPERTNSDALFASKYKDKIKEMTTKEAMMIASECFTLSEYV